MTSIAFKNHIRSAIADAPLQTALDANAKRRHIGREAAFESLPDIQGKRRRAHAVRADVIEHLEEYLTTFTAKVSSNGIHVHRAADAAQAIGHILEIVGSGPTVLDNLNAGASDSAQWQASKMLFAKSKSMVSEEIELNHALEALGHRVVETDLGEYIVQLRGEKPAHIITPAVHLQRQQVGQLFEEKLGTPYTDDINKLTAAARAVLREVFISADVGISGINFGVVDTGTLCIVTNEGNGRMVTTLPPIHIALMGMERLVPTLDDLDLMLSLLPRSATGQKMTVYTQLIHSPRRAEESEGARERHLIIVDNGRSQVRDSHLREALYCIRCGACLNACPVFREIGGHAYVGSDGNLAPYPGPIGSILSPGLSGLAQFGHLAQASSLCGACKDACPVDIDLPKLLTRVRASAPSMEWLENGIGLSSWSRIGLLGYARIATSPRLFRIIQWLAGVGMRALSPASRWMHLPAFTGWGTSRDFPRPSLKPFRARWRVEPTRFEALGMTSQSPIPGRENPSKPAKSPENAKHEPVGRAVEELTSRFSLELEALGASVLRVNRSELSARLIALFRERSIGEIATWDAIDGVESDQLIQSGLKMMQDVDPRVRGGLTGCECAIAETGSLVLLEGVGKPLTTSLLPEVHVAIVNPLQIVWSLEEALRLEQVREASAAVVISGASRTADIEMTLTIGVHGPKELIVCILE